MNDLILQSPAAPSQMILLLHGVGSCPEHLKPLGQLIASSEPNAVVVALAAPISDQRGMLQWFSVQQVTEENRPSRVAQALPMFFDTLNPWLQRARASAMEITLFGFSQGGIMLLEAAKTNALADCQLLICSSRFATLPQQALQVKRLGWIHGQKDPLFPVNQTLQAVEHLQSVGQTVELMIIPQMQHELPGTAVIAWLQTDSYNQNH